MDGNHKNYSALEKLGIALLVACVIVIMIWAVFVTPTESVTKAPLATKIPETCLRTAKLLRDSTKGIMTQTEIRAETLEIYKKSNKDSQELQGMAEALLRATTQDDGDAFLEAGLKAQDICVPPVSQ